MGGRGNCPYSGNSGNRGYRMRSSACGNMYLLYSGSIEAMGHQDELEARVCGGTSGRGGEDTGEQIVQLPVDY